jgi:hypothetical protein
VYAALWDALYEGRVEQADTRFAASFVGTLITTNPQDNLRNSQACTLAIRPEAITLDDASAGRRTVQTAVVTLLSQQFISFRHPNYLHPTSPCLKNQMTRMSQSQMIPMCQNRMIPMCLNQNQNLMTLTARRNHCQISHHRLTCCQNRHWRCPDLLCHPFCGHR